MDIIYDIKDLYKNLHPIYNGLRNKISSDNFINIEYATKVDITELIKPFKHLTIDNNFRLLAYSSKLDILGIHSVIIAIKNNVFPPEIYLSDPIDIQRIYKQNVFSPLEVIFCDGTAEGYLETVIFNETIKKLERGYKNPLKDFIFSADSLGENPNSFIIKPDNWNPKHYTDCFGRKILLTYEQDYLNGVALCEYYFPNGNSLNINDFNSYFVSHITPFNDRFFDRKQCCLFLRKEIQIRDGDINLNYIV